MAMEPARRRNRKLTIIGIDSAAGSDPALGGGCQSSGNKIDHQAGKKSTR